MSSATKSIITVVIVGCGDVVINVNAQDGLTNISRIEPSILRCGRTMLVLSLDPNTKLPMLEVFSLDNPIRTGPIDHIPLPGRQDKKESK